MRDWSIGTCEDADWSVGVCEDAGLERRGM
jgi:hypothetical protein